MLLVGASGRQPNETDPFVDSFARRKTKRTQENSKEAPKLSLSIGEFAAGGACSQV